MFDSRTRAKSINILNNRVLGKSEKYKITKSVRRKFSTAPETSDIASEQISQEVGLNVTLILW